MPTEINAQTMLDVIKDLSKADDFHAMTKLDWDAFAGAEEGTLIAFSEKYIFLLAPNGQLDAISDDTQITIAVINTITFGL